ncbi:hypothetical protein ILP97_17430 [Amycolatopsis sp. H6(2020)]|nr:hypothetical protein [Amycolatopsis sp. H6(2020)]
MPELVRVDLPSRGSGFTLRQPDRFLRMDHVEFPVADGSVLLFREMSHLHDFLASDAYWRDLVSFDNRELDPERARRYDLRQMVDGTLRWGPGDEAGPCSELCAELAFHNESVELLDELGPHLGDFHGFTDVQSWRRIIPILVSLVRFWGEPDEPVDPDTICEAIQASFFHGP